MEKAKFIKLKKEEYGIKEYIKRNLGKGKISRLDIEYTPVGEKIIILTAKPGLVIGRKGEKIEELTNVLKTRFKLENPHIEIKEIKNPLFDAQLVADEIAMALERMGNLKFKVIAYKKLQEIMRAGALGCEIRMGGKLPSDRAKSWRFAEGYLKKAGESSKEVERAQSTALTKLGISGIKVAIMSPEKKIYDRIIIGDNIKQQIKPIKQENIEPSDTNKSEEKEIKEKKAKKSRKVKENKEESKGSSLEKTQKSEISDPSKIMKASEKTETIEEENISNA
ncbi:MAG: 30S ribosomal protein S3 [Nanoarchaeota archaeon]